MVDKIQQSMARLAEPSAKRLPMTDRYLQIIRAAIELSSPRFHSNETLDATIPSFIQAAPVVTHWLNELASNAQKRADEQVFCSSATQFLNYHRYLLVTRSFEFETASVTTSAAVTDFTKLLLDGLRHSTPHQHNIGERG